MFDLTPYGKNNDVEKRNDGFPDIDSFFGNFMGSFMNDLFPSSFYAGNQMKVDIKEDEKGYVVEAELPGVSKEDINIDLRDDRLMISVERNEQINVEKENYVRKERRYGSMSRGFYVEGIDRNAASAKFENGILTIQLPKRPGAVARSSRIEIA